MYCIFIFANTTIVTRKRGENVMNNSVKKNAKEGLNKMKFEVAREIGVDLKDGYNGQLTSAQAGSVGGYMVKKLIEKGEQSL